MMQRKKPLLAIGFVLSATVALILAAPAAIAAEKDNAINTFVQAEQLEYRLADGKDSFNWEARAWVGEDKNKLWLKTEGEQIFGGELEGAEVQLLYSRMISPFWDFQIGGRYDARPDPSRGFGVIGVQGLAPYFFEVDAAAFVSHEGDVSARIKADYELLLTQKLVLQPSVELAFAIQEVKELDIGPGLSDVELGLRLRYEVVREFAPYIGLAWERKVGRTATLARNAGEDIDRLAFVGGIRFWF